MNKLNPQKIARAIFITIVLVIVIAAFSVEFGWKEKFTDALYALTVLAFPGILLVGGLILVVFKSMRRCV